MRGIILVSAIALLLAISLIPYRANATTCAQSPIYNNPQAGLNADDVAKVTTFTSTEQVFGERITAGSSLIGQNVSSVEYWLEGSGVSHWNVVAAVIQTSFADSSNYTIVHTFGSFDNFNLPTTNFEAVYFDANAATPYTLHQDDVIAVIASGGDTGTSDVVLVANSVVLDSRAQAVYYDKDNTWQAYTQESLAGVFFTPACGASTTIVNNAGSGGGSVTNNIYQTSDTNVVIQPDGATVGSALGLKVTIPNYNIEPGHSQTQNMILEWSGGTTISITEISFAQHPEWFTVGKTTPFNLIYNSTLGTTRALVPLTVTIPKDYQGSQIQIPTTVKGAIGQSTATVQLPTVINLQNNQLLIYLAASIGGAGAIGAVAYKSKRR